MPFGKAQLQAQGVKPINIYDISKKAGVSIATVSRVLNGSEKVTEKTRIKVQTVMEAEHYKPNLFARGLTAQPIKIIGVLCPDSSDIYLAKAIYHIEQGLRSHDYNCILCCTGYNYNDKMKGMQLLNSNRVDAVILVGSTFVSREKEHQKYVIEASREIPVVLINGDLRGDNIFSYYCDDEQAMEDSVQLLLSHGKKNILFFYNAISYSARKKYSGYLRSIQKAGMEVNEELLLYTTEKLEGAIGELEQLEESGTTFDSVIATEDFLAVAALKYAQRKGLSVPEEFEIIGYNNSMLSLCCTPELSSIDSRIEEICHEAVKNLVLCMENQPFVKNKCFSTTLVERNTTK